MKSKLLIESYGPFSMNRAQRKLVGKICLSALILFFALLFSGELSGALGEHRWMMWLGIIVLTIGALSGKSDAPTYTERHFELNRILDENPWMKIFYAIYGIAVAAGSYYVISHGVLVEVNVFLGALLLVMMPIIIYKIRLVYEKAGDEVK